MRKIRKIFSVLIVVSLFFQTGCWNYREIDKVAIVAGVAVDKLKNGQLQLAVEIIKIKGGKDSETSSELVTVEGITTFDASRNGISVAGKKLYWSHAKVIVFSREVAEEGILEVLDYYIRDAETREDIHLFISEEKTAKEILKASSITEKITSISVSETIENQKNLSKATHTDITDFCNQMGINGMSPIIPSVRLKEENEKLTPEVTGTAVFKEDKLKGFLDAEETKTLLFIRNDIKGGVLPCDINDKQENTQFTLEIFKNKTKIKPIVNGNKVKINLDMKTVVAINEIDGSADYIIDDNDKIEKLVQSKLEENVINLVKKVQTEYDSDIFGFSAKLYEDNNKAWKKLNKDWDKVFKEIQVEVKSKVHIEDSGILANTIKKGG